jgi:hypothetical protein
MVYAITSDQPEITPQVGPRPCATNVYSAPGDADRCAKTLMLAATSSKATVANAYASHAPLPVNPNTSGKMSAGVADGAMLAIDCAAIFQKPR